ncbi:MAG: hypothetical protein ABI054_08985 [Planctomycetota bacterium]
MKQAKLGVLALLVLLLGVGWWWFARSPATAALRVDPPEIAGPVDPEVTSPVDPVPDIDARASVSVAAPDQPTPTPSDPVVTSPSPAIQLSGTIIVIDAQGLEHRTESGRFHFVLWHGSSGSHLDVEVVAGIWSTSIPASTGIQGLELDGVVLGDRRAFALEGTPARLPAADHPALELRVHWSAESLLYVRDRASGRDLDHVMVVDGADRLSMGPTHPGESATSAQDLGASPIHLSPLQDSRRTRALYARSAGYAWGRIELDCKRGGERFLLLDPGGDLEVELIGNSEDPNAMLRLFATESEPVFEFGLSSKDALKISGLLPGEYRLAAQIGEWWRKPVTLGEVPALIFANETTRVVLAVTAPALTSRVPLGGTLVLPEEWDLGDFSLEFELLGTALGGGDGRFEIDGYDMTRDEDKPGVLSWKAPDAQPGRYEVELRELGFSVGLDVPPQGLLDARIEVPQPAWVEVRCLDDATGADLEAAEVGWHFAKPKGVSGWSDEDAEWNAELRCFRFRAPIGSVMISADCDKYESNSRSVKVAVGTNNFEFRLSKQCGLRPILRDDTTVIPWEFDEKIKLVPAEGQKNLRETRSLGGGVVTLYRLQPGLYTLKLPQIPGYLPVPDETVRLETGVVVEHVVQLVREH